jgi:hypothetical protein
MHPDLPNSARFWPEWVRDRAIERICMMREANNLDLEKPLPFVLRSAAIKEAEENMELLAKGMEKK